MAELELTLSNALLRRDMKQFYNPAEGDQIVSAAETVKQ
jgi:hypothetical protein